MQCPTVVRARPVRTRAGILIRHRVRRVPPQPLSMLLPFDQIHLLLLLQPLLQLQRNI